MQELFETSEAWVAQQEATDVERKRVVSLRAELGQVSQELRDSDEECKVRHEFNCLTHTHIGREGEGGGGEGVSEMRSARRDMRSSV